MKWHFNSEVATGNALTNAQLTHTVLLLKLNVSNSAIVLLALLLLKLNQSLNNKKGNNRLRNLVLVGLEIKNKLQKQQQH
jgi:hypothetical protein